MIPVTGKLLTEPGSASWWGGLLQESFSAAVANMLKAVTQTLFAWLVLTCILQSRYKFLLSAFPVPGIN